MNSASTTVASPAPRRASLARNIVAMYALQAANFLIPLVTLPYLIRNLGAESYGVMAMAYAVVFFMVLFVDAGFNTLAMRRLAKIGRSQSKINEIVVATQLIKLALCAAMFLLLCALSLLVPRISASWTIYLATFPIVVGSLLFPTWLFQGLEIMHFTTLCSVGGRLLATLGIFVFVGGPEDLVTATLLQASATALSGVLCLPLLFYRIGLRLPRSRQRLWSEVQRTLSEARLFAPAEYLTNSVGNSGVFILGLFATDAAVGVYAAIEKVARAGASIFSPLTGSLIPKLTGRWHSKAQAAHADCRTWTRRIVLLASFVALGLLVLAPFGLEFLFGDGWSEHASLLRTFALWLAINVAATVTGQFWLLARGYRAAYSNRLFATGCLQLVGAVIGGALYGPYGLVASAILAEATRLALFLSASRRVGSGGTPCAS